MNLPITTATWLERFAAKHGDRYSYPPQEIRGGKSKVTIICPDHGPFEQAAGKHAEGDHCRECSYIDRGRRQRFDTPTWIARARAVHGDRYDYTHVVYRGDQLKVIIVCTNHGEFRQVAGWHTQGRGCPTCGNERKAAGRQKDLAHFVERARAAHGDKYDYSQTVYSNALAKVTIVCPKHGIFEQTPANHGYGYGCQKCVSGTPSPVECDLFAFVQSLCPDAYQSDRTIIKPKELDIVVPSRRLAIELNGVYWHSDRRTRERGAARHKYDACAAAGYRLIAIACKDWTERRGPVEQLVRSALGADNRPALHARECRVVAVPNPETVAFLDQHHPQQPGAVYAHRFGLEHPQYGLVAVMTFARDAYDRNRAESGVWDLTRFATSARVRGGASKLFTHAVRTLGCQEVVSYSANDWFAGQTYAHLGFDLAREIPPDYRVYHHALGFRPKSSWARKRLPDRLRQIGRSDIAFDPATDPRTEWEIEDAVNAFRMWDSGKKLWKWTKKSPA
jgi:hypothetical protein